MRWRATLEGDQGDLSVLADLLPSGDVHVVRDGEDVWLSAEASGPDVGDVLDQLDGVLAVVNGLGFVLDPQQRPARLSGHLVDESSGQRHTVVRAGLADGRGRAFGPSIVTHPPGPVSVPPGPLIMNQRGDPAVDDVLRLWGTHPHDFFTLYKIVEIIEDDVGGKTAIVARGWATKTALDAFGASANNRQASGDLARHAVDKGGMPKRTITLEQARTLVAELSRRWLLDKAGAAP